MTSEQRILTASGEPAGFVEGAAAGTEEAGTGPSGFVSTTDFESETSSSCHQQQNASMDLLYIQSPA